MPHRRTINKGSFGGHFDELVQHFPTAVKAAPKSKRKRGSQEDRDIHALLFERAWQLDRDDRT